jgi:hypothetical protein
LCGEHGLHDVVWRKFAEQCESLYVWLTQIAAIGFSERPHEDRLPKESIGQMRVTNAHVSAEIPLTQRQQFLPAQVPELGGEFTPPGTAFVEAAPAAPIYARFPLFRARILRLSWWIGFRFHIR